MNNEELDQYSEDFTSLNDSILNELERYTNINMLQSRMLSGKIQGRFLAFVSKLLQPKNILEIGTYSGYSALCLAEGLAENGVLHSVDKNDELEEVHEKFIRKSPFSKQIKLHYGKALDIIPEISSEKWELVFIDADKSNYLNYYKLVLPNMKKGSVIIADNVLWSGKVLDEKERTKDCDTKALHEFNKFILEDDRVENFLLPVRDGLMILRVK